MDPHASASRRQTNLTGSPMARDIPSSRTTRTACARRLTFFASPEDPVKIIHLKVENTLAQTRRITATQYIEWVLGTTHAANMAYIIPEYDSALECLSGHQPLQR